MKDAIWILRFHNDSIITTCFSPFSYLLTLLLALLPVSLSPLRSAQHQHSRVASSWYATPKIERDRAKDPKTRCDMPALSLDRPSRFQDLI